MAHERRYGTQADFVLEAMSLGLMSPGILSRAMGVSTQTARRYLDLTGGTSPRRTSWERISSLRGIQSDAVSEAIDMAFDSPGDVTLELYPSQEAYERDVDTSSDGTFPLFEEFNATAVLIAERLRGYGVDVCVLTSAESTM